MVKNARALSKRTAIIYAVILVVISASVVLYIYSRTYAKSARLGVAMTPQAFDSIMGRTVPALIAMSAAAILIAIVSLSFQTITASRILTPSMIGFDSVFVGTQTILVFLFGSASRVFTNPYINYSIAACVMVAVSMLMYGFILRKNRNNIVFLLMFGMILSGVVRNASSYLLVIMNTNDYNQVQAATAVSINNMNTRIIYLAVPLMAVVIIALVMRHKTFNVMALGADNAKSLGVAYNREVTRTLILVSLGMSIATALIGSLTFLGLLTVNIAREVFRTHRHIVLFIGSALIAACVLILGQGAVEMLQGAVPVTALIDLVGCSYMFYLILKENKI